MRTSKNPESAESDEDLMDENTDSKQVSPTATLGLCLLLWLSALAGVSTPATAESFAFVGDREGFWSVYVSTGRMASPMRVDSLDGADANAPALSRDSAKVAFEVAGEGIEVCGIDSQQCQSVIAPIDRIVRPVWNDVRKELLFVGYRIDADGEDSDIWMVDESLENPRPLLTQTGNQDFPAVSDDGRYLAHSSLHSVQMKGGALQVMEDLWIADLVSGVSIPLVSGLHQNTHPDWSPDGEHLAFASNRSGQFEVWIVDAEGSNLRQVTEGDGAKTWPAWSPDGAEIMFTRFFEGRYGLWKVDRDGSNLRPYEPFGATANVQLRDADWR